MIVGLQTILEREQAVLAPYAMHSAASRGRRYPETEHPYRGPFQRDRDRIVHSAAFRRLSGKLQVFTGDMGDYHRTRLTHTHEVASIARTLSRALRLNEDLVEALALFHDLGHPPYGHSGEEALNEWLSKEGGFSHNQHALTLVEVLEDRYPHIPGLNLSFEVLESQATRIHKEDSSRVPLYEAQIVDLADSITYDAHDTDDAVKLQLVSIAELREIPLIRQSIARVQERFGPLSGETLRKALVHELIDWQVGDLLAGSISALTQLGPNQVDVPTVRLCSSPSLVAAKRDLEQFLYDRVYRHPQLVRVRLDGQRRLRLILEGLLQRPELLPEKNRQRIAIVGPRRAIAEYVAGMTDRFCDRQYEQYFTAKT